MTTGSGSVLTYQYGQVPINIRNFGADPTGVADSTTAIQNAINAATGVLAPSSHSRVPTNAVYMPTGTYKITTDLAILSTQGFNLYGDGAELTILAASGTGFTTGPIVVDGSYAGRYRGFTIKGDGTEQVTNAFTLTWTTAASRSTTGNLIEHIRIRNLKFVTGMNLAGVTNRQVDSTRLDCVVVEGGLAPTTWTNVGNWQQGFTFGSGTFANIYDQVLTRCDSAGCYYGMYNNVSSFALTGSQPANNYCDFYMNPGAQSTITNVQSQNCGTFLIAPSSFAPEPTSFNDIQVKTSYLQGTNGALITLGGGYWNFNNFNATNCQATTQVAAGSNGGQIANVATWSSPSAGVLDVASVLNFPSSGTATVATSTTTATITYSGTSAGQLTGCAYVSGSATGLVATGGNVGAGYVNGTVSITGSSVNRPCVTMFNNLSLRGPRSGAFALSNAIVSVHGYTNYEPTTGNSTYATGDVASLNTGGIWTTVGGPGALPQVNYITATGVTSYTIPATAQTLDVLIIGGGAGGSSGALAAAGNAGGGAGGGGGGVSRTQFSVAALTSPVSVTVGTGGAGGAAITSTGAGASGVAGGTTAFGSYMWAGGGKASSGGSATNSVAVTGGAGGVGMNVSGQAGSTVTAASTPTGPTAQATGGGGAGGGVNSTAQNGAGCTAPALGVSSNSSAGGVVGGATPTNGNAPAAQGDTAPGGGGGAAITGASTTAQNGADARANSGGGGGGGGACSGGTSSGAGGAGGSGFALIIAYFQ
jgi:hypothetical protein